MCLESLRTVVEAEETLCFHLADNYCGKPLSQHWLQLKAIVFCRQARIHVPNQQTYTLEKPRTRLEVLSVVHDWSCTNMGDRPLRRTIWQDRRAVLGNLAPHCFDDHNNATGKWLITQPKPRPNYLPWISYANTDILQAPGTVVLSVRENLVPYSATARYVIREYEQEHLFRLQSTVGIALRLINWPTAPWIKEIVLLCTRASNKHPLLHEVLHACLTHLTHQFHRNRIIRVHLLIYDPELDQFVTGLVRYVTDQNLEIVLHDRVYVSIPSIM